MHHYHNFYKLRINSHQFFHRYVIMLFLLFQFLSDKLLKERLEIDTLQDVGTLKNRNFYTKFIKVKTKL